MFKECETSLERLYIYTSCINLICHVKTFSHHFNISMMSVQTHLKLYTLDRKPQQVMDGFNYTCTKVSDLTFYNFSH